uniref:Venom peptide ECTX1-Rm30a n=1 Tax=Rhytidoponera metallica TaxID=148364 RepID=A0A8U0LTQ6_RHYMT|nr:venom peptide precursor ECTX1-Rm30a [Rhytidoponera metallica]
MKLSWLSWALAIIFVMAIMDAPVAEAKALASPEAEADADASADAFADAEAKAEAEAIKISDIIKKAIEGVKNLLKKIGKK